MNVGDLVFWWHTPELPLFGYVRHLEERPGVEVCSTAEILYLDREQLHSPAELPDGVYSDLPYHPNPSRLSPNAAKRLLEAGGPARFDYERKYGRKSKPAWDFGKLAHLLVLGEGDQLALIDAPNYTTKYAREQRDKAYAEGVVPVLRHEFDTARAMADAVHAHPLARELLADGDAEQWLYATLPDAKPGLRMRLDWMTQHNGRLHLVEYKTAASADPAVFARKAYDFGYHIAFAFAVTCAQLLELDAYPAYLFITQEKEPPYLVSVNELDPEAYRLGYAGLIKAIDIYQRCMDTDSWPGYGDGINPISLPPWAFRTNQPTIGELLEEST